MVCKALKTLVLSLIVLISYQSVFAERSAQLATELESVTLQIEHLEERARRSNARVRQLERNIAAKRAEVKKLQEDIKEHSVLKETITSQISQIRDEIIEIRRGLREKIINYQARLVQLHKIRQQTMISSIFTARDLNTFLTRFEMVKYLLRNDLDLISNLREQGRAQHQKYLRQQKKQKHLAVVAKSLEEKSQKLENESASIGAMLSTVKLERKLLKDRQARLQATRDNIEKSILEIESQQDKKEIESALAHALAHAPALPAVEKKKARPLPDTAPEGAVLMNFSWPVSEEYIEGIRQVIQGDNKNLVVSFNNPTEILATGRGKVLYRGVIAGLGNVVILAHQRGFSTVYGNLDEIWVGLSEVIEKHQPVGKISSIDKSLHFEIRFGGRRHAPLEYLPPKRTVSSQ